jgi:hypothetical protein
MHFQLLTPRNSGLKREIHIIHRSLESLKEGRRRRESGKESALGLLIKHHHHLGVQRVGKPVTINAAVDSHMHKEYVRQKG